MLYSLDSVVKWQENPFIYHNHSPLFYLLPPPTSPRKLCFCFVCLPVINKLSDEFWWFFWMSGMMWLPSSDQIWWTFGWRWFMSTLEKNLPLRNRDHNAAHFADSCRRNLMSFWAMGCPNSKILFDFRAQPNPATFNRIFIQQKRPL